MLYSGLMVDSLLGPKKSAGAPTSRARRRGNRLARTIVLGTLAVIVSLYWLGESFGVDWTEIRGYLLTSLLFVAVPAVLAVLGALVLLLVKRLRRRRHGAVDSGRFTEGQ